MAFTPITVALDLGLTMAEYIALHTAEQDAAANIALLEEGSGVGASTAIATGVASMLGYGGYRGVLYASTNSHRREDNGQLVTHSLSSPIRPGGRTRPFNTPQRPERAWTANQGRRHPDDPLAATRAERTRAERARGGAPLGLHIANTPRFGAAMPYSRTTTRRSYKPYKRSYKRRTYTRKRTTRSFAPRVKRIVNSIAEKKYVDVPLTGGMTTPSPTWGSQIIGPLLLQGITAGTRIGNRIYCTRVELQMDLTPTTLANFVGTQLRCILLYKKDNAGGTTVTTTDVFTSATVQNGIRNNELAKEFSFLGDFTITIPAGQSCILSTKRSIKVAKQFIYSTNLATGADLKSGCMYLMCNSTASSGQLGCVGSVRIFFTDN